MGKKNKIISIRWNEKNLKFFQALDYIDGRSGKVKPKDNSFNRFINNVVTDFFVTKVELQKKVRRLKLIELEEESKEIERKMREVARYG